MEEAVMRVRFLKRAASSLGQFGPGDEADIPAGLALAWVDTGLVMLVSRPLPFDERSVSAETAMLEPTSDAATRTRRTKRGGRAEVRDGV